MNILSSIFLLKDADPSWTLSFNMMVLFRLVKNFVAAAKIIWPTQTSKPCKLSHINQRKKGEIEAHVHIYYRLCRERILLVWRLVSSLGSPRSFYAKMRGRFPSYSQYRPWLGCMHFNMKWNKKCFSHKRLNLISWEGLFMLWW